MTVCFVRLLVKVPLEDGRIRERYGRTYGLSDRKFTVARPRQQVKTNLRRVAVP